MLKGISDSLVGALASKFPEAGGILLVGSAALNVNRPRSDFDVYVMGIELPECAFLDEVSGRAVCVSALDDTGIETLSQLDILSGNNIRIGGRLRSGVFLTSPHAEVLKMTLHLRSLEADRRVVAKMQALCYKSVEMFIASPDSVSEMFYWCRLRDSLLLHLSLLSPCLLQKPGTLLPYACHNWQPELSEFFSAGSLMPDTDILGAIRAASELIQVSFHAYSLARPNKVDRSTRLRHWYASDLIGDAVSRAEVGLHDEALMIGRAALSISYQTWSGEPLETPFQLRSWVKQEIGNDFEAATSLFQERPADVGGLTNFLDTALNCGRMDLYDDLEQLTR